MVIDACITNAPTGRPTATHIIRRYAQSVPNVVEETWESQTIPQPRPSTWCKHTEWNGQGGSKLPMPRHTARCMLHDGHGCWLGAIVGPLIAGVGTFGPPKMVCPALMTNQEKKKDEQGTWLVLVTPKRQRGEFARDGGTAQQINNSLMGQKDTLESCDQDMRA
jgi:hypothetical protein